MKIFIQAKPAARAEAVEKIDETHYRVSVTEPPIQGRANAAICRALANYFHVAPTQVQILSGHTSRAKVVEIMI